MADTAESGKRGRPRDSGVDAAIAEATIALLLEKGVEALSIDAVAQRSGVGRPTIYRRFKNKEALVTRCVWDACEAVVETAPRTDAPLEDVLVMLDGTVRALTRTPFGGIFRAFVPYLDKDDVYGKLANDIGRRRRGALRPALERAQSDGALDPNVDTELLADGVLGSIYFRFLLGRPVSRAYAEKLLLALGGPR